MKLAFLIPLIFVLAGCASPVKKTDYAPSPEISENARPSPLEYRGLDLLLPPGMTLGTERSGILCQVPGYPLNRSVLQNEIDHAFLMQAFHDAMEANGYDVVSALDIAFDAEEEAQRAEYAVKGQLKDVQLNMCTSTPGALNLLSPTPGEHGELYVAIDWTVYDYLTRKIVYKVRTEGYTKRTTPNTEGLALMFQDAFEMATHNLAADEKFRTMIVEGVKPPQPAGGFDGRGEKIDGRPRLFDADEEVTLLDKPLSVQPFGKTAEEGRKTAVMIQNSGGHGSGFFITKEGHIITNAHVVGEARKVRIVTASRKTGIVAEVLRVDRARDVALLKLEEIPEWVKIETLPIRLDWPKVGEDVYAIGTPVDWKMFRSTVTKGIVSAHRRNQKINGVRENYIQADVEIHSGSSGGPLVDEYGNIIGLTVMGEGESDSSFANGLNLFVPIQETLDRLGIAY